jgi:hypothetical protein
MYPREIEWRFVAMRVVLTCSGAKTCLLFGPMDPGCRQRAWSHTNMYSTMVIPATIAPVLMFARTAARAAGVMNTTARSTCSPRVFSNPINFFGASGGLRRTDLCREVGGSSCISSSSRACSWRCCGATCIPGGTTWHDLARPLSTTTASAALWEKLCVVLRALSPHIQCCSTGCQSARSLACMSLSVAFVAAASARVAHAVDAYARATYTYIQPRARARRRTQC